MKNIIFFFLFILSMSLASATTVSTANYKFYFETSAGGIMDENLTSYNASIIIGESIIGNDTYLSRDIWLGFFNYTRIPPTDSIAPNVTQITANNTQFTTLSISLNYNVTDSNNIINCSLYINSSLNITDTTITKNIPQSFSPTIVNGDYSWLVSCEDNFNNVGNSSLFLFNKNYQPPAEEEEEEEEKEEAGTPHYSDTDDDEWEEQFFDNRTSLKEGIINATNEIKEFILQTIKGKNIIESWKELKIRDKILIIIFLSMVIILIVFFIGMMYKEYKKKKKKKKNKVKQKDWLDYDKIPASEE